MIKRLNNAKRQTNYLVCNIEVSATKRCLTLVTGIGFSPAIAGFWLKSLVQGRKYKEDNFPSCHEVSDTLLQPLDYSPSSFLEKYQNILPLIRAAKTARFPCFSRAFGFLPINPDFQPYKLRLSSLETFGFH